MHNTTTSLEQVGMLRRLSPDHWSLIAPYFIAERETDARSVISHRDTPLHHSLLLMDGIVGRRIPSAPGSSGRSHLVALQVPGDFVDLHAFPLRVLDHDVIAVTRVRMAEIRHGDLRVLLDKYPDLARALWSLTLVDAAIHRHWALRNGTMRALQRVANLFAELVTRLDLGRRAVSGTYTLDLTQPDIGDACGLSGVHVNRVLRDLREAGCCTYAKGQLVVQDRAALDRIAAFNPSYLYQPAL